MMMDALLLSDAWLLKSNLFFLSILILSFGLRKKVSAAFRHFVWIIGFGGMLLIPLLSMITWQSTTRIYVGIPIHESFNKNEITINNQSAEVDPAPLKSIADSKELPEEHIIISPTINWWNWIYSIWILGIIVLLFKLIVERYLLFLLHRKSDKNNWQLNELLQQLQPHFHCQQTIQVAISQHIDGPFTTGWINPIIYVPESFLQLERQQQEFVFLHELAHIQRWDWLSTFLTQLTKAIFWFNPLVWLAAKWSKIEMEKACDDMVINATQQKYEYASLMLDIIEASNQSSLTVQHRLALANKNELQSRMMAILDDTVDRKKIKKLTIGLTTSLAFFLLIPLAGLQIINEKPSVTVKAATIDLQEQLHLLNNGSDEERKLAAWTLGTSENLVAVKDLSRQIHHNNPEVRIMVLWALGELKAQNTLEVLLEMTKDKDAFVREMAVKSIGELEQVSTIPTLSHLLKDKTEGVRAAAVWALGEIHSTAAIELAITALTDPSLEVKKMVIKVLGTAPSSMAVPKLATTLESNNLELKLSTLAALDRIQTDPIAPLLIKVLSDPNPQIRSKAAEALGHLGNKVAANALMPLLQDPSVEVREMAVWALDELRL